MGYLREFADVESSFKRTAQVLDDAVNRAKWALADAGFETMDESNRSGFDHSGYPNFFWRHRFRRSRDVERGVLLEAVAAWQEPTLEADLPGTVKLHASIVVFYHGQSPPLFASTPFIREVPLEACAGEGLRDLLQAGLRQAEAELPDQYRAWLEPPDWLRPAR